MQTAQILIRGHPITRFSFNSLYAGQIKLRTALVVIHAIRNDKKYTILLEILGYLTHFYN